MLCLLVPPVCFQFHSFASLYFSIMHFIFFIHFSTVLLDSRREFNSSEIFLHAVRASLLSNNSWFTAHNWTSSFCSACDHVSYFTFFFPLLSFVLLFPPLLLLSTLGIKVSERGLTCFHACKGQRLSCRHLFATELVPVAGSRVGVIGISKKLLLVFRVSIIKTIERRVRWTGKKIILSRHRTC